jgi:hypothetical protein
MESDIGKIVGTSFCALAETHNESTKTVTHNMCDLHCILYLFYRAFVPTGTAQGIIYIEKGFNNL